MIKLFCTRQLPEEVIHEASRNGIEIVAQNFIRIVPLDDETMKKEISAELKHPYLRLLFTSKNAAAIAMSIYFKDIPESITRSWRLYCLSGATRKTLLTYFNPGQVDAEGKDAEELKRKIKKADTIIHFFCGDKRRNTLPDFMKEEKIPFREWVIYKTVNNPVVIEDIYRGYLFYSPSAVESFFSTNRININRSCFAIGETTAAAIRSTVDNQIYSSDRPNHTHLLQTIYNYFDTPCRN